MWISEVGRKRRLRNMLLAFFAIQIALITRVFISSLQIFVFSFEILQWQDQTALHQNPGNKPLENNIPHKHFDKA